MGLGTVYLDSSNPLLGRLMEIYSLVWVCRVFPFESVANIFLESAYPKVEWVNTAFVMALVVNEHPIWYRSARKIFKGHAMGLQKFARVAKNPVPILLLMALPLPAFILVALLEGV